VTSRDDPQPRAMLVGRWGVRLAGPAFSHADCRVRWTFRNGRGRCRGSVQRFG
jgi:hypothetical protein